MMDDYNKYICFHALNDQVCQNVLREQATLVQLYCCILSTRLSIIFEKLTTITEV